MTIPKVVYFNIPDDLAYERQLLAEWGIADQIDLIEVKTEDNRPETFLEAAQDADGVIVEYFELTGDVMRQMPNLKIASVQAIGSNNIDSATASELGVAVSNTPGFCVDEVAVHTVGLIIDLSRNISRLDRSVRAGKWDPMDAPMPHRLAGKTVGLVFFGGIPQRMVPMLRALELDVVVFAPTKSAEMLAEFGVRKAESLEELLRESDYVSLHTPLLPETRGLIGTEELGMMKPTAFLINTARGAVVDEKALVSALEAGGLAGAGIDVIEDEDTEQTELRRFENVVITPHAAFLSEESFLQARRQSLQCQIDRLVHGVAPRHLVNRDLQI
ncbi:C-terminal binding protein [Pseudoclavibacter sp. CFCC 13796]|uniref:C-terminal binding protein n=1 Tax=Pseudoclavibacter sp. CFCC 13796 TaxID=2615179 RepID=UPI0013012680|nr:C-terminal binding protein [Pseudoclavibacter sp. CFCC 13796]KAB1660819.1 C-terminal binding protein [Pseudoclavibacter sp. CFCC 13796]